MRRARDHRAAAHLAALQQLACEQRRAALALACQETHDRTAVEEHGRAELGAAGAALDAVLARPQLCLDRMTLAAARYQSCDAALRCAQAARDAARHAEDAARAGLDESEHRARTIGRTAARLLQKHLDKRADAAAAEAIGIALARRGPA